jgi:hypothetical protein
LSQQDLRCQVAGFGQPAALLVGNRLVQSQQLGQYIVVFAETIGNGNGFVEFILQRSQGIELWITT